MSELEARQNGDESGSLGAGSHESATPQEPATIDSPLIAPDHEAPKADAKIDPPKADEAKVEPPKIEAAKPEMPKAEPFKVEGLGTEASKAATAAEAPRVSRELLIMSPRERNWEQSEHSWESQTAEPKRDTEAPSKTSGIRRFAAIAAMLVLGVIAGAAGGALATVGVAHFTQTAPAPSPNAALEASVARIDADIAALKAGLEQTSKASQSQFNKTNDRLDRIEKAQVEPTAKLAKLSEAIDKLRTAPAAGQVVASATPAAAKEATGSVTAPAGAQSLPMPQASPNAAAPKSEVARLPTVDGWVLREVGHGGALIEGRSGLYEVYAGDPVPGLGRIDAIRRQDGRWVVVTSRGLIVAR
ncbi:hypothetical protein [Bradyrhizobium sp. ARR65]|uniref:hypothetical protein n=1 Tax=Bradyrhizobium sp. ARR65 TaxID=1040989 RepID=UPI000465FE1D|nr:hypothetical protein [Bradyrhizobium sp. ARR65]